MVKIDAVLILDVFVCIRLFFFFVTVLVIIIIVSSLCIVVDIFLTVVGHDRK